MYTAVWLAIVASTIQGSGSQILPAAGRAYVPSSHRFCVNLSNGIPESPPSWANWLSYSPQPGSCNDRAVLELTPPSWAKSLRIEESATDSNGWTLNLGDSPTNNGYGGDASSTTYDAELQILNGVFQVYKNDVCGSGELAGSAGNVGATRHSLITVHKQAVRIDSCHSGYSYSTTCNTCVYDWSKMYLGMNRVVNSSWRTGTGLCTVCIEFSPYDTSCPC